MIPFQPVPTSVDVGPDGFLYVGQLTGFPFPVGGASVWRIPPNGGTPEVFDSGFTTIIDIEFADDGSLYVLQISTDSLFIAPPSPGALIRVAPDGTRTTVAMDELSFPGGLAIGEDGDLYVSNRGTSPSGGQVLRIAAPD
jgi:sugar lactone lactonase YvrE